ncbi:DNA polymerase IV [Sporotomaculum syntrophicum]|uniref:DNA polymerase IV n=1 Tax=Sporotomaculum syntrophicum TaxID=182264 RepID=A0A9D3AVD4_9FIRM|nr:DNA polymerase IV [Sporotomaculum syntrophicum]KAF1083950.1 DNA polymerase IV [Sporotomaculum syntrophicum]
MQQRRIILHSDLNSFYASVEIMLEPALQGKAVAVCGSTEDRHGIVLAKSELAKKAGVKTGQVTWEARLLCPDLIVVPPQYEQYLKYSRLTREIYQRYTDQVEPFGMDECWLDVTASRRLFGSGEKIAEEIRQTVKEELGLTVSIGVSFNKIFAKLGSDMKKPDAVTVISREDFKEKVWPLPTGDLLYVGRATVRKLAGIGVHTIGDIVALGPELMQRLFGKNGLMLWSYASGQDTSRVMPGDYEVPVKSIGHGITCTADLINNEEVWRVFLELSQDIGHRLRVHDLLAWGVQIAVRDNTLFYKQYQAQLGFATRSPMEIARKARELFEKNYQWQNQVRAVTVRAINLVPRSWPQQLTLFDDYALRERRARLEDAIESLRARFGKRAVFNAVLMGDLKMSGRGAQEVIMPGAMYR